LVIGNSDLEFIWDLVFVNCDLFEVSYLSFAFLLFSSRLGAALRRSRVRCWMFNFTPQIDSAEYQSAFAFRQAGFPLFPLFPCFPVHLLSCPVLPLCLRVK
jgi:hypothetical protein